MRNKRRPMETIRSRMKAIAASWDGPYSNRSAACTLYIWQRNRSIAWHLLMQRRAKRGYLKRYVRGI
jgi:hypothetical protein